MCGGKPPWRPSLNWLRYVSAETKVLEVSRADLACHDFDFVKAPSLIKWVDAFSRRAQSGFRKCAAAEI